MGEIQEISLEETNKLRAQLGLPLIPVDDKPEQVTKEPQVKTEEEEEGISVDSKNRLRNLLGLQPISSDYVSSADQESIARQNFQRKQQAEQDQKQASAEAEAYEEAERQRLLSKYDAQKGILNGEEKNKTGVESFLKNLKKGVPKKSEKLEKFEKKLAEQESRTYSEKDLTGLRVGHSLEDFESLPEGTELTLKDTGVLEDGEDELVSSELLQKRQREKYEETRKTRNRRYHGYDDDSKGMLAKYDEEEEEFFVLTGGALNPVKKEEQEEVKQELRSANDDFDDVSKDVLKVKPSGKPAKFKKRKKSSKPQVLAQVKRRRVDDEDEEMRDDIDDRDDDYDVQARLAKNRLKVLKEKSTKVDTADETIDKIMENKFAEIEEQKTRNNGVLLNDTTQFLSSINLPTGESDNEDEDLTMGPTPETPASSQTPTTDAAEEVKPNTAVQAISSQAPTISGGLGDTLRLLRSAGHIKEKSAEEKAADERRKNQARIKLEMQRIQSEFKRKAAEEKEQEETLLRHLTPRERAEYQQRRNERLTEEMSRAIEELFRDYKPEVTLKYYDNEGNELDSKGAYKHLSHQFHGRDPGKAKIEKMLKKKEEAKKKEQRSIFNPMSR
ncbi:66 kDa U4/U6.U5 small nuclear ribonucleoprotein component [Trichomonascus vanleenenianus]|uniref:U4/U6-U5 snRNP complex subunit SNU66 n=1 Tax=Trichomonascus vanleenenianus TaxID=2268995 RepID=UPI003EC964ED